MAQATFSVNDSAAVSTAFTLLSQQAQDSGYTALSVGTPQLPCQMNMRHTLKPIGAAGTDRHLIQSLRVFEDTEGVKHTVKVNVTFEIPRTDAIVAKDWKDPWYFIKNYLTDANLAVIVAGGNP